MKVLLICFTRESDFAATMNTIDSANKYCDVAIDFLLVVEDRELENAKSFFNNPKLRFDIQPDNSTNNNGFKFLENYFRIVAANINEYDHIGKIDSDTMLSKRISFERNINYAHKLVDRFNNSTIYGNFYVISKIGWGKLLKTFISSNEWKTPYVKLNYGENRCIAAISERSELTFSHLPILNIDCFSNWSFKQKIAVRDATAIHFWSKGNFVKYYSENGFTSWLFILIALENFKRLPKSLINFFKFYLKLRFIND